MKRIVNLAGIIAIFMTLVACGGGGATSATDPTTPQSGTVQLPKTGQTVSYGSRDDGALQKGVAWPNPRFTDNANGTVTDNLTGLVWLKNANCLGSQTWASALTSANTLANGACGLNDGSTAGQWRLPNINELESLVDISRYPALPQGHPFTPTQARYWSSTTSFQNSATFAWYVSIFDGEVDRNWKSAVFGNAWPVRSGQSLNSAFAATVALPRTGQTACYNASGAVIACSDTGQDGDKLQGVSPPNPRFTNNANGTITDNLTGLIWLKDANCFGKTTWESALTWANTLASSNGTCNLSDGSTAGQWRLPNRKELLSLVDRSNSNLPSGHPFVSLVGPYWSSSSRVGGGANGGWYVFTDGSVGAGAMSGNGEPVGGYVWPVRGGL